MITKNIVALLMIVTLLLASASALAEDTIVVGGENPEVALGDKITVTDMCDITFINFVSGEYISSIPVWERPDDVVIAISKQASTRDQDGEARKWENYSGGPKGYLPSYVEKGYALKASTKEYKLIDVRCTVLNVQLSSLGLDDKVSTELSFMDKYTFSGAMYM